MVTDYMNIFIDEFHRYHNVECQKQLFIGLSILPSAGSELDVDLE